MFTPPLCKRGAGGIESPNCNGGKKPIPLSQRGGWYVHFWNTPKEDA